MPSLLLAVLTWYRRDIDVVMHKLATRKPPNVAACTFTVDRLDKLETSLGRPNEVSPILLSMASKFEKFQPRLWWWGVWQLAVRLLQTSLLTYFRSPNVQCAFAAVIGLVSVVLQRELQPFRIASDGAKLDTSYILWYQTVC